MRATGATGGGYILSKGTTTKATLHPGSEGLVSTIVNGDPRYRARTTRRAVSLLVEASRPKFGMLVLNKKVETPIGSGFGASAASAVSAVYAAAAVLGIRKPKHQLALYAHRAEVLEQTGLGTVSVVYDAVGAGAITKPGDPGHAKFVSVKVPPGTRIVTACIAPYDKKDALSSKGLSQEINRFGQDALRRFQANQNLGSLGEEGERFSSNLGLESFQVKRLRKIAKSSGAIHASQNMIGYAIHAIADSEHWNPVAKALAASGLANRVDVFRVGSVKAGTE